MSKNTIIATVGATALLAIALGSACGWYNDHNKVLSLEMQVDSLKKETKRSAILSSVSRQLEEISSEQQLIAEEKREDALRQKFVADSMSDEAKKSAENAIKQQKIAEEERNNAKESAKKAQESEAQAIRESARAQFSERQADTLRYVTLGRSLGSASSQTLSSNLELAQLLAYYSYHYTHNYGGEDAVYYPAVFQSLVDASHGKQQWNKHQGMLTCLDLMPIGDTRIVTASNYGEVKIHQKDGSRLRTTNLINDRRFDFRHLYVSEAGDIYVVSRSGHLVVIRWQDNNWKTLVVEVPIANPLSFNLLADKRLLVIGEHELALVAPDHPGNKVVSKQKLDFKVVAVGLSQKKTLLFDDRHNEYLVSDMDHIVPTHNAYIKGMGMVTAYVDEGGMKAYGTTDGTIHFFKDGNSEPVTLVGHESRISQLIIYRHILFSSSYDGKINLWNTKSEKIEPMKLVEAGAWILKFINDSKEQRLWMGDQYGNLTEIPLEVDQMKDIIADELKAKNRDFTQEEWNYYIGKNEPYVPIIGLKGKEAGK